MIRYNIRCSRDSNRKSLCILINQVELFVVRQLVQLYDKHGVDIVLKHDRVHASDCNDCGELEDRAADAKLDRLSRRITLTGDLSEAERQRLLEIADRCPVHRTLENHPVITTQLDP